ncbi:MAG: alkaline phosphatase family protein [Deltaproteobacteria bacterium]|nr:alkaline phosphatase family protein [Deltaproteobacteria bacterium]
MRRKKVAGTRSTTALVLAGIPQGLRLSTLWDAVRWSVRERVERPDDDARFEAMQLLRGRIDRDVFVHAMHKHQPDLATFTYYATDGLAHRFWTYHQPDAFTGIDPKKQALYGETVRDAYRQADQLLGELQARVSPETTVVVVSDHGFRAFDPALDQLGFQPLTERLRARLIEQGLPVDVSRLGIKLNVGLTDGAADRLPELRAALEALVDETGAPVFRVEPVPGAPNALGLTLTDERVTEARIQGGTVGGRALGRLRSALGDLLGHARRAGRDLRQRPRLAGGADLAEHGAPGRGADCSGALGHPPGVGSPRRRGAGARSSAQRCGRAREPG